jgi:hydrogenase nickel incorporation protein HypA/HybF
MHEMALTESIVEIALETAQAEGAKRVTRIFVDVGALGHVEPEALQFCFAAVAAGTLAEGAALEIERIPGAGFCADCGKIVPLDDRWGPCPECGGSTLRITAGEELKVRELEIA